MKCYNHPDHDAVGVCKSCQKGICMACSTTIDDSLSCKGRCEEDVAVLNYIIERGRNLGSQWTPAVLINSAGGVLFLGFGLYNYGRTSSWLLIGLGSIMIVGGILSFLQSRKISNKNISRD